MEYSLAKQLKDAGFQQYGWGNRIHPNGEFADKNIPQPEPDTCYVPTLSELIDFVDGSDILNSIEKDYVGKTLFKLQKDKEK